MEKQQINNFLEKYARYLINITLITMTCLILLLTIHPNSITCYEEYRLEDQFLISLIESGEINANMPNYSPEGCMYLSSDEIFERTKFYNNRFILGTICLLGMIGISLYNRRRKKKCD
jgi:hypothetical protein